MGILNKKTYTPDFKSKVALEALREERTVNQIASSYEISPSMVTKWRAVAVAELHQVFAQRSEADKMKSDYEAKIDELHRQIGEQQVDLCWLKKNIRDDVPRHERMKMLDSESRISLSHQCELLSFCRSSTYYVPKPVSERELLIKRHIDEIYTEIPVFGSRKIAVELDKRYKIEVDRRTIAKYMQEMGIYAISPKPNLSKPKPEHKI